jgi:hypothetical protein
MYRLSEHSLAIDKGCRRQTRLSREDRYVHTAKIRWKQLHFLTSCHMPDHIRDIFPLEYTDTQKFENKPNFDKHPYLLGKIPQCAITATRFVTCCHRKRATSVNTTHRRRRYGDIYSGTDKE